MSEKVVIKVKRPDKRIVQRDKLEISHDEMQTIRKWLITGSFSNSFFLNESFDKEKITLIKKVINVDPDKLVSIIEEAWHKSLNKSTFVYLLVLLSSGNFKAKKIFKTLFNKIITSPKELYQFMEYCKKERGFGQVIHEAIKTWFKSFDIHVLEWMFVEHRCGFNWTSQDVIRLIKPKPTDKKEQLLFKWIANGTIESNDMNDYCQLFPRICAYEALKSGKIDDNFVVHCVETMRFKNSMIPGNVERSKNVVSAWLNDFCDDYPINSVPRYLDKLTGIAKDNITKYLNAHKHAIPLASMVSLYSELKDCVVDADEMAMFNTVEDLLIERVKKNNNISVINIVDNNEEMFSKKLNGVKTTPAVVSSILIGNSKNVVDFEGNVIYKRDTRAILEAEGYIRKTDRPYYKKIFDSIEKMAGDTAVVWTNNRSFDKKKFNDAFVNWKKENNRIMKLVVINLTDNKHNSKCAGFKEVYGFNDKTEKLLEYIKKGEI